MTSEFYHIPLHLGEIPFKKESPRCTLKESVARMIHLIAITNYGEYKPDETFGCEIWEFDFENISNSQLFKEQLMKSLKGNIEKHETRLSNVRVNIQLEQVEVMVTNRRTKSRITLSVEGILSRTNEPFYHTERFFLGPLSYY
ncbi:MAG: GPW/gp25 family protein [Bacteroidetes bacterium]|nr:GPW/gp25 family protein [Bacteroidota bacterium]